MFLNKMSSIWILIVIILVLLIFYFSPRLLCRFPPLRSCSGSENRLSLPLWLKGGVYMTRLHLGDNNHTLPFDVVPDTGSNILIVSGPLCSQCNRQDGIWNPSIGQDISCGIVEEIRFVGGQRTSYLRWRAQLLDYSPSKQIDFGVIISSITPDGSPLNVLGLQGEHSSGLFGKGPPFLDSLCGEKNVLFDFPNEKLYIGSISDLVPQHAKQFSLFKPSWGIAFTLGRITQIKIDDNRVAPSITPRFGIFDTGTTLTIVSRDLSYQLVGSHQVELFFESNTSTNPVSVIFNSPAGSVDNGHLPFGSSMLLGNIWLRQYSIAFKHEPDIIIMYQ